MVTAATNTTVPTSTMMVYPPGLTVNDFPTGRLSNIINQHHPKICRMAILIDNCREEFAEAAVHDNCGLKFGEHLMLTKTQLILLIVDEIKPSGGGSYKKKGSDGTWVTNETFNEKKLRKRISNGFGTSLKLSRANAEAVIVENAPVDTSQGGVNAYDESGEAFSVSLSFFQTEGTVSSIMDILNDLSIAASSYVEPPPPKRPRLKPQQEANPNMNNPPAVGDGSHEDKESKHISLGDHPSNFDRVVDNIARYFNSSTQHTPSIFSSISAGPGLVLHPQEYYEIQTLPSQLLEAKRSEATNPTTSDQSGATISISPTHMEFEMGQGSAVTASQDRGVVDEEAVTSEMVRDIVLEIRDTMQSTSVLTRCLERLADVLISSDDELLIEDPPDTRDGVVRAVTDTLIKHLNQEDVLYVAFSVLASLSDLRGHEVPNETIGAVISVMHHHPKSSRLQAIGCNALNMLVWFSPSNQTPIAAAGGIEAVISAMQGHPNDPQIQENGCRALVYLAYYKDQSNQTAIATAGGIEVIVAAMWGHPNDANVQRRGCSALGHLTDDDHESNKTSIAKAGGIEAIVAAMQHHVDDPFIQISGSTALSYLANNHAANQEPIAEAGGIEALIVAMRSHYSDSNIQEYGCSGLAHLADTHCDNQRKIAAARGIDAVIAAMRRNPHDYVIQGEGCKALGLFGSDHAPNRVLIGVAGGISAVVAAKRDHPKRVRTELLCPWLHKGVKQLDECALNN